MDKKKPVNPSNQSWIPYFNAGQMGGHRNQNHHRLTTESNIVSIEHAERVKMSSLSQHADRLYSKFKAQDDAVRKRLGLSAQKVVLPPPKPPAAPSTKKNFHQREGKLTPLSEEPPRSSVESPIYSVNSLSSVDSHTPEELRAIPLLRSPDEETPARFPVVQPTMRRKSQLPVYTQHLRTDKKLVKDVELQTAKYKVGAVLETLENFQAPSSPSNKPRRFTKITSDDRPLPQKPQTSSEKMTGTRFQADQSTASDCSLNKIQDMATKYKVGDKLETFENFQAPSSPSNKLRRFAKITSDEKKKSSEKMTGRFQADTNTASDFSLNKVKDVAELKPLSNPTDSLSICFTLLSSDEWKKKISGMKIIRALAQHHTQTLENTLHEVCLLLIEEVNNLRSAVACEAMDTIAEIYLQLRKTMDPEVELTGRALLLKLAKTTNTFIHQRANLALDAMVQNCSHGRTVSALLNTGLSHRCIAVRVSTALHLQQVTNKIGASRILSAGRNFTVRFLTAVSKMSVDAAPDVRYYGQIILKDLSLHQDFLHLWAKIIPETERRLVQKQLKLPA